MLSGPSSTADYDQPTPTKSWGNFNSNTTYQYHTDPGADPGFLRRVGVGGGGGSILGLQATKGGSRRASNFGPNVKKPT